MKKVQGTSSIIVIIATKERTELLENRSLKSVYEQIDINPHQVYIVDDNDIPKNQQRSIEYPKIEKVVKKLRRDVLRPKFDQRTVAPKNFDNFFHTTVIPNTRTKGFSGTGAWNTAAFKALKFPGKNYYLAFLDDDDEWTCDYLTKAYREVSNKKGKVVAFVPAFLRKEQNNKEFPCYPNKDLFTKEGFFVSNPGLQSSNLFVNLKDFWAIGGFDENLKSATDRDFGIRLCEFLSVRKDKEIVFSDHVLVTHHAYSEKRVTSDIKNKHEGLGSFYKKHFYNFSKEAQRASLKRSKELFGYTYQEISNECQKPNQCWQSKKNQKVNSFNLVIGVISDNRKNLTALLDSFLTLHKKYGEWLLDYKFLILKNTQYEYEINPIVQYFQCEKGLSLILIDRKKTCEIPENRTYLQQEMASIGGRLFGDNFFAWVIDDDHLFKFDTKEGKEFVPNYFQIISEQSTNNVDALLCKVSDAPPLPFLSTMRTQLIDFYYHLLYFHHCNPKSFYKLNSCVEHNQKEDFYYDLSGQNFQHLEQPFYCCYEEKTNNEIFIRFIKKSLQLYTGSNPFRKIMFDMGDIGGITKESSIYRGGNTVIFNSRMLKIPNYTPCNFYTRRSDFNWAIIAKNMFDCHIKECLLPLKHDRSLQVTSLDYNQNKFKKDLGGLIFYRVFNEFLAKRADDVQFNSKEFIKFHRKILIDTLNKVKINNLRCEVLIVLILCILQDRKAWWNKNEYRQKLQRHIFMNILNLQDLADVIGKRTTQATIDSVKKELSIGKSFFEKIVADIEFIEKNVLIEYF